MEFRVDPLSGRKVVIAPGRAFRPGAARSRWDEPDRQELDECPFCAGREDRTPPETLRLPRDGAWRVRVVPNKYPAFDRQEVVVHTPEHLRSVAELDNAQLDLVAEAWRRRRAAEPGGYLLACINEGRQAGASLPHSHSQLVWLPKTPPAVAAERNLDRMLEGTLVSEQNGIHAVSPVAARAPYELRLAPRERRGNAFDDHLLGPALQLLAALVRRLRHLEGPVPFNAWLHDGEWWHLHFLPRLTVPAGIELGAGIDVNPLPPAEAARRLSELSP
jgi:UDPglucose--hexose-1-phosphate uridylyltransferase